MSRVTEQELILPSLFLMDISPDKKITTSKLIEELVKIFKPSGRDNEIISGRKDTYFTQKVRNLKSHNTLERLGYAEYEKINSRSGFFKLTEKGKKFLDENIEIVRYLLSNDFPSEDLKKSFKIIYSNEIENRKKVQVFDEKVTISEGAEAIIRTKVYERSNRLREEAIKYYTVDGRIKCKACCFDFEEFYGDYGKNFIEIHHKKPIFQFDGEDLEKTIEEALKNVVPVCSNCHRMIHRRRENPLSLEELKNYIQEKLDFCK